MKKLIAVVAFLTLLLGILTLPAMAAIPAGAKEEVVRLVNAERAKEGLPALKNNNSALNQAAQKRATELPVRFAHDRPDGRKFSTVLVEYKVQFINASENIGYGTTTSAARMMQAWMNSPSHRDAILTKGFTHIGVGIQEHDGKLYWVQEFIKPLPLYIRALRVITYPFQIAWLAIKTLFGMIF